MGKHYDGHDKQLTHLDPMEEIKKDLEETERSGQEVLSLKSELVHLDFRRNKNREALRAIQSSEPSAGNNKTWICSGTILIKTPIVNATQMITEDQKHLDQEIKNIRNEIQEKTLRLSRKLDGKKDDDLDASHSVFSRLIPLTSDERDSLSELLPQHVSSLKLHE